MILAAGLGKRMLPLTAKTPKPLLPLAGRPLISYHLEKLAALGCAEVVVNVSHLADQLVDYCGDGGRWGLNIRYSREPQPLETAGGIQRALPMLGSEPFLVLNGDIWTSLPLSTVLARRPPDGGCHLVLVDSPPQHPLGDFLLSAQGQVIQRPVDRAGLTYAGIGVFDPAFFADMVPGCLPLRPLLDAALPQARVTGVYFGGEWEDVGTPERLARLDAMLSGRAAGAERG